MCVKRSVGLLQFTSVGPEKNPPKNKTSLMEPLASPALFGSCSGPEPERPELDQPMWREEEEEEEEVRFNVSSEETETHVVFFSLLFLSRLRFPIKSLVFAVIRVRSALF